MPRINLLPWREAERKRKRQEFFVGIGGALALAVLLGFAANLQLEAAVSHQNDRNQKLKDTIAEVDKQITEVLGLEQQQKRLEDRMDVIDKLQHSRPVVVHLFDQIVHTVPDGVFLTLIKQTNDRIQIKGVAQSSTRVSTFMRNIESSEWLADPDLEIVENKSASADAGSEFTLYAKQAGTAVEETTKKPARNKPRGAG